MLEAALQSWLRLVAPWRLDHHQAVAAGPGTSISARSRAFASLAETAASCRCRRRRALGAGKALSTVRTCIWTETTSVIRLAIANAFGASSVSPAELRTSANDA